MTGNDTNRVLYSSLGVAFWCLLPTRFFLRNLLIKMMWRAVISSSKYMFNVQSPFLLIRSQSADLVVSGSSSWARIT